MLMYNITTANDLIPPLLGCRHHGALNVLNVLYGTAINIFFNQYYQSDLMRNKIKSLIHLNEI